MSAWIVRRRAGGIEAVMRTGSAVLVFATSEAAEVYRAAFGSRFASPLFEVEEVTPEEVLATCEAHGLYEIAYSQDDKSGALTYELASLEGE